MSQYVAMLRAEAELDDNHFRAIKPRDLRSGDLVHVRAVLQASVRVKAAFTPERWKDLTMDVAYLRDVLDHSYNPTPLWTLIGGGLANLVPAGGGRGVFFVLIQPNPEGLVEITRFRALDGVTWNPPAFAAPILLARNDRPTNCPRSVPEPSGPITRSVLANKRPPSHRGEPAHRNRDLVVQRVGAGPDPPFTLTRRS
jgi:hypothetical protein